MAKAEYIELENQCCANCSKCFKLQKWDYSHGGCKHTDMDGFICTAYQKEGIAVWTVGLDVDGGMCEAWEAKEV